MRTVIVTSLTTGFALPLLLLFAFAGRGLIWRVAGFVQELAPPCRMNTPLLTASIWLYATFSMLAVLSPAPVSDRAGAVLMMAFLLQAGTTDAVSGFLPRTFTGRFLLAGVLWQLVSASAGPLYQLTEIALAGTVMMVVNLLANGHAQRIGRGDLWLITGLTAWMGITDAALVTLCGLAGFVLWLMTWRLSGKKEGPLGPWLCLSGSLFQLNHLYQPVWVNML